MVPWRILGRSFLSALGGQGSSILWTLCFLMRSHTSHVGMPLLGACHWLQFQDFSSTPFFVDCSHVPVMLLSYLDCIPKRVIFLAIGFFIDFVVQCPPPFLPPHFRLPNIRTLALVHTSLRLHSFSFQLLPFSLFFNLYLSVDWHVI